MIRFFVIVIAALCVVGSLAAAELFYYTDGSGTVHMVDDPAKVPKKYREQMKTDRDLPALAVVDGGPSASQDKSAGERKGRKAGKIRREPKFQGTVQMYVTSGCDPCRKAEAYMKKKRISYEKYDIESDQDARRRYEGLDGREIPLILIGSRRVSGFSAKKLDGMLFE